MQKEEFQHTAYSTNAYIALGPLAKQILQGMHISHWMSFYEVNLS